MAPSPPTVVSLKQSFLTAQTRLLSQPLTPSRAWQNSNRNNNNNNNEDTPLPEKAVDDALFKLNHHLQQHARRVYAPQATRHVAEQIDQLYWNAAEAATARIEDENGDDEVDGVEALKIGADLTDPSTIATLPLTWEDPATSADSPLETKRYAELAAELHALAERKRESTARAARLRRIKALLEPFSPDSTSITDNATDEDGASANGSLNGVQENLVTRNGEVEKELHRMRMLLARVGGRVGRLKEQGRNEKRREGSEGGESSAGSLFSERGGVEDVEMDEQRKVGLLLERF